MRSLNRITLWLLPLLLVAALLAGCSSETPKEAPTAPAAAQAAQPTNAPAQPTPTLVPPTPTPKPPTATPTPKAADATSLLQQVQTKQQEIKSARGSMEIAIDGVADGQPQSVKMGIEFEIAEPDSHMKMSGDGLPMPMDIEFISKGDTTYMNMGGQWMAIPGGSDSSVTSEMKVADMAEVDSLLSDASNVKVVGRRIVKNVECDIISFDMTPSGMQALAELLGSTSGSDTADQPFDVKEFKGEVAIGVADKVVHEMSVTMKGNPKDKPDETMTMSYTISMWDINSPDIVIEAPAGATTLAFPTPSQ
ncbi:MAG: hypothetical protein M0Z94_12870 [Dehalococcoidales bacterium]|nr:hypothetical protein [Dehalococcoidales bacterium]